MNKFKLNKIWYGVGVLLLLNVAVYLALAQSETRNYARLEFFDIGQGDSIYLRTVEGNDVLIDGGPGDAVLSKLGEAMPFFDRTIELMVLTHPHADHVSGLVEVLKRYKVKRVVFSDAPYDSAVYETFLTQLKQRGIETTRPRAGQRVYLDGATVLDFYYPETAEFIKTPSDVNDISAIAKLSFGRTNVLLTGDAGKDIEEVLLRLGFPLDSEILKVGHHGSRHSTSEGFLSAVSPDAAVISVGDNNYGHPHEEVLGLLHEQVPHVYQTDENGGVIFALYPDHVSRCMDRGCKKQENMK
ncbi:MAG: internalization-related competence protein ComEC/Rec2 protein [Parcubacteria group bacterium GW2011_GWA2_51_12]|nr:MAG: internalization-related competence protein ComEC/Rec2 protein [Parcubacteria group bacterium GW2011_GWA2_51_12]